MLRSQIMCRSPDQVNASRWLESIDIKIALCSQQTQGPFQTLCADVITLLDWQKVSGKPIEILRPAHAREEIS